MFDMYYDQLDEIERDNLKKCINILISENFVLREVYSASKGVTQENSEYRFIDRHSDLIKKYLSIMGWSLHIDRKYGVAHAFYKSESSKYKFSLNESMFFIALRLIYNEGIENLTTKREVRTTTKEVINKLISTGAVKDSIKPTDQNIAQGLKTAKLYNIIAKQSGNWTDASCKLLIYPTILFLVSNSVVKSILEKAENREETSYEKSSIK